MSDDAATLARLWPRAPAALRDAIIAQGPQVFRRHGINTPLRLVHFMAQISEETDGGSLNGLVENMNYTTPQRIAQVWPTRFTVASAAEYVRNAKKLASKVYNGRMGNRPGTEDGYYYRGHGLLQLTGRSSYDEIGRAIGVDLVGNPDLASSPQYALEVAACEFQKLGALPYCDKDDIVTVTKRVNGGLTNLAARKMWLAKWKQANPHLPGDPAVEEENVKEPRGSEDLPNLPKPPITPEQGAGTIVATTAGGSILDQLQPTLNQLEPLRNTIRFVEYLLAGVAFISLGLTLYGLWHKKKMGAAA